MLRELTIRENDFFIHARLNLPLEEYLNHE